MKTALLVLWLYSASGFGIGPISLGPGWYATKNHFTYDQAVACHDLGEASVKAAPGRTSYGCWDANDGPPESEWAKVIR